MLVNKIKELEKRTEKLESKTNQNSQNSSKPTSSDSPFNKPTRKRKKSKRKRKRGAQKGHKGHKQELLQPTQQQNIVPKKCDCGCSTIIAGSLPPYYTSQVLIPFYDKIDQRAREYDINHVDETSWFQNGALNWLWVMVNSTVAYFMIHQNRSKEAFLELIQDWTGILISDNYGTYKK